MLHNIALWGGLVLAPVALIYLSIKTRFQLRKQEEEISALLEGSSKAMQRLDGAVEHALVALRSGEAAWPETPEENRTAPPETSTADVQAERPADQQQSLPTTVGSTPGVRRAASLHDPDDAFRDFAKLREIRWRGVSPTACRQALEHGGAFGLGLPLPDKYQMILAVSLPDKYQMWAEIGGRCEVDADTEPPVNSSGKFARC